MQTPTHELAAAAQAAYQHATDTQRAADQAKRRRNALVVTLLRERGCTYSQVAGLLGVSQGVVQKFLAAGLRDTEGEK